MNLRHKLFVVLCAFIISALFGTACNYESEHLDSIKCSQNEERQGDRVCKDNLWIYDPLDAGILVDTDHADHLDSAQPSLDADNLPHDVSSDANDTSQSDSEVPDAREPDIYEHDMGLPDATVPLLANNEPCDDGIQCISGYCDHRQNPKTCQDDLCNNEIRDPGETDVDCGGSCDKQCDGYLQVVAGGRHTCAIRNDNTVICWGHENQMIGMPSVEYKFKELSAGNRFVCGILLNGPAINDPRQSNVYCWGALDDYNEDDHNDYGIFTTPANITFDTISAGREHVCGISAGDSKLHCWGNHEESRTNPDGNPTAHDTEGWTQISAGTQHSCATNINNRYKCWGDHSQGQREFGDKPFNNRYKRIVAADAHTCVIHPDDKVECVVKGNPNIRKNKPAFSVSDLDSRSNYACAIHKAQSSLVCWGDDNKSGRVNDVPKNGQYKAITTGWNHACALSDSGVITCWGNIADDQYPAAFRAQ